MKKYCIHCVYEKWFKRIRNCDYNQQAIFCHLNKMEINKLETLLNENST